MVSSGDVKGEASETRDIEREQTESLSPKHNAPDGGWGWVVCFACVFMNIINNGISLTLGIIFVELLDQFQGSKADTSWILSLSFSVCFLEGPIVAALINQFGCRVVAFVGTLLSVISLILSIFTPNLYFLYFTLGILLGLSGGLVYIPGIVCVSQYFNRRRALATGLCVGGTGLGVFIFSPLTTLLIETYTWRGTLLVQVGLLLNCLACSLVFKPLPHNNDIQSKGKALSDTCRNQSNAKTPDSAKVSNKNSNTSDVIRNAGGQINTETDKDNFNELTITAGSNSCHGDSSQQKRHFCLNSVCNGVLRETYNSFRESMNLRLFRNKAFALFMLSSFILNLGYYIPYTYLPVKARDAGIGEIEAALIISTIGITSTVSRVVFGFISDRKWVNRMYLYSTSLVLCGTATSLGPVLNSFTSLLIYAVVFGMFCGVIILLLSVLIADIVGIENLSNAYGMINVARGVAILLGPPAGGWLYDISGSYDGVFLASGICLALAGVMLYVIPCIDRNWNKR